MINHNKRLGAFFPSVYPVSAAAPSCVNGVEASPVNIKSEIQEKTFYWTGINPKVSVQGVKSLCSHFACLCREFDFLWSRKKE